MKGKGLAFESAIISLLPKEPAAMEAEKLNQLAGKLADLRTRIATLRRYL